MRSSNDEDDSKDTGLGIGLGNGGTGDDAEDDDDVGGEVSVSPATFEAGVEEEALSDDSLVDAEDTADVPPPRVLPAVRLPPPPPVTLEASLASFSLCSCSFSFSCDGRTTFILRISGSVTMLASFCNTTS